MDEIMLDSMFLSVDGRMRIEMERAKRAVEIDRSYTCFKGTGSVPISSLVKCTWLAEELREAEYM